MLEVQSRAYRQQHNRNYKCAIPNNIFGFGDNFHLESGHVAPAVIRKIYEAKMSDTIPTFWGDGSALREFTFADNNKIHSGILFFRKKDAEAYLKTLQYKEF
jgi:GDP-L-fucose synthase